MKNVDYSPWKTFEARLAVWFGSFARPRITFRNGRQGIPGLPNDREFRSDALLTDGRTLIALEVEFGQSHPDTNVGKYWLLDAHCSYERVLLFHVYTPRFNSYGARKVLGDFYAKKMAAELPFTYVQFDRRTDSDPERAFAEISAEIEPHIVQAFGRQPIQP